MSKYKQTASSYLSDLPLIATEVDSFEENLTLKMCDCTLNPNWKMQCKNCKNAK